MFSQTDAKHSRAMLLAVGMLLLAASTTLAAAENAPGDWEYGLQIYGWLPSLNGELSYAPRDVNGDIHVGVDQILDALNMTFMGSFEARKGPWSGFTDLIYLNLGGDKQKSVSVPDGATRVLMDADLDITGWIWTLGGAYSVWEQDKSHLDLLVGARMFSLDTDLTLTGGGARERRFDLSDSVTLWDGIVGAKGRIALNERWFLPYYLDVGTGDTDRTWQGMAGVGYEFDWGEASLTYRYLEYDQNSDAGLLQHLDFGGIKLGVGFRF